MEPGTNIGYSPDKMKPEEESIDQAITKIDETPPIMEDEVALSEPPEKMAVPETKIVSPTLPETLIVSPEMKSGPKKTKLRLTMIQSQSEIDKKFDPTGSLETTRPIPTEVMEHAESIALMIEADPSKASILDLKETRRFVTGKEARAEQAVRIEAHRKVGRKIFKENPEAFVEAFGYGGSDLIPRNERIQIASEWITEGEKSPDYLLRKGILTADELIGAIESTPENTKDTLMAEVFKAKGGEPLFEVRQQLEKMGEMNEAGTEFLNDVAARFPELGAQERLERTMDLRGEQVGSMSNINEGINTVMLAEVGDHRTVRKARVFERAYATERMLATRLSIEPGKSADAENIGQDYAFLIGIQTPEVIADVDKNGTESVQRWVGGEAIPNVAKLQKKVAEEPEFAKQMELMGVLDWIIMNSDRHSGNLKVADGELLSLDLGAAFADDEFDQESYEAIKGDIFRENPNYSSYADMSYDELPETVKSQVTKYAKQRLKDCGTNSVALELLRREGVEQLSAETLTGVNRIKKMMDAGESSPMFRKMVIAWGEDGARRHWKKTAKRVDKIIETGTLPQNSESWHEQWSEIPKTRVVENLDLAA
ncbi:MAG: hypothetical protein U9Q03_04625 [Patescibacteria group bacterium]|nr:hypothetical protein [Patescibacteria group bacterium]